MVACAIFRMKGGDPNLSTGFNAALSRLPQIIGYAVIAATVGMILLSIGMDLITLFVALELMVISVYILTGFLRRDRRSNEAALKYL